jgi:hypothetical protein
MAIPATKPPIKAGTICGFKAATTFPPIAAASAPGEDKPTLGASTTPTRTAIDTSTVVCITLKSFATSGGKGMGTPAAAGRFASKADTSTSKNESTPAIPAIHKIRNTLVLNFIFTCFHSCRVRTRSGSDGISTKVRLDSIAAARGSDPALRNQRFS